MSPTTNQELVVKNVGQLDIKNLLTAQILKDSVKSNIAKENVKAVLTNHKFCFSHLIYIKNRLIDMKHLQRFENYDGLSTTAAINKSVLDKQLYKEVSKSEFYDKRNSNKYEHFTTTEKDYLVKYLTDKGADIQNTSMGDIDFTMKEDHISSSHIPSTIQKRYDGYFAVALNPLDNPSDKFRFFICDQFDGLKDCLIYNLIEP